MTFWWRSLGDDKKPCKGRGVCPSCNGRRKAQTAAHLVDHVIPSVPVRQWVISVPKRLRWFLAERADAVAALTRIFVSEVERLVRDAAGVAATTTTADNKRPRVGAISFLHRFGAALNRHVHLHVCVTDGVFQCDTSGAGDSATIAQPAVAFLPCRPITPGDLDTLTARVRKRLIRWFRLAGLLDAEAAAVMLAWKHSGFSVDASVRISLDDRDVPSYTKSLEHLVRYCARPAFALERLTVIGGGNGRPEKVRYTLPRHKRGQWIGPGRQEKATAPDAMGRRPNDSDAGCGATSERRLGKIGGAMDGPTTVKQTGLRIWCRHHDGTGTGITGCSRRITRCEPS